MSKITLSYKIFSSSSNEEKENIRAIKNDNNITYKLDGIKVNITILNNNIMIKRESNDMELNLEFQNNKSIITSYYTKDLNINIKVETKTKKLVINQNSILINYDLYMNDEFSDNFQYELEWRC